MTNLRKSLRGAALGALLAASAVAVPTLASAQALFSAPERLDGGQVGFSSGERGKPVLPGGPVVANGRGFHPGQSITLMYGQTPLSTGPITANVPYATAPLPPGAWPSQPTVYYAAPGTSAAQGVFAGNGSVYIAIPASQPVTSIEVAYAILATTTGGIGLTAPTFMQCDPPAPAPAAVPTLNAAWLIALALGLPGTALWTMRRRSR